MVEGRQTEAGTLSLRQSQCLCLKQQIRIQSLPLSNLETLADARLDFHGPEKFKGWLGDHTS
jgi:hypothetical protein